MRTGIIIQARMGSTRFPGKVLMPLPKDHETSWPVLYWVVQQCRRTGLRVVVATSTNVEDNAIELYCKGFLPTIPLFRGDPVDVLDRLYRCATDFGFDEIVRITGDCPFICAEPIEDIIALRRMRIADYASNVDPPTWPDGLDCQVVSYYALKRAWEEAKDPTDRDTVLQYIVHRRTDFISVNLPCPLGNLSKYRWVLDTEEDYERLSDIARIKGIAPGYVGIHELLRVAPKPDPSEPDVRNERYLGHRAAELGTRMFTKSVLRSGNALKLQPYGASTYSKSHVAWGTGGPLYVTHAQGSRFWDVDGNEFIDMTAALGTNVLGYCDPVVNQAIKMGLDHGIAFPLAHDYEVEVANNIIGRTMSWSPGDWKLMFGKNGSDVTSAAVRVARVATRRDLVAVLHGSYHGWHDWSVAETPRAGGVEEMGAVERFDMKSLYGALSTGQLAAVIVEPDKVPGEDLSVLMEIAKEQGTLVIFDEMVTAFRYWATTLAHTRALHPDMICLGKALGNGMPISCLIGRDRIMNHFVTGPSRPHYAFFSGTHFGELLSLLAASEVCRRMDEVRQSELCRKAIRCAKEIDHAVKTHEGMVKAYKGVTVVRGGGKDGLLPRIEFQGINAADAAHDFRRQMAKRGVLVYSMFLPTLAHSEADLDHVAEALHVSLEEMQHLVLKGPTPDTGIMRS